MKNLAQLTALFGTLCTFLVAETRSATAQTPQSRTALGSLSAPNVTIKVQRTSRNRVEVLINEVVDGETVQILEPHHTGRAWRYIAATHLDLNLGRNYCG